MDKKRLFLFFLLIFILIVVFIYITAIDNCYYWYDSEEYSIYVENNSLSKIKNNNLITSIKVENNFCMYDNQEKYYLCSVSDIFNYNYKIDVISAYDVVYASTYYDNTYTSIELFVHNDKYYDSFRVFLTTLPILNINTNYSMSQIFNRNNNDFVSFFNSIGSVSDDIFVNDELVYMSLISPSYFADIGSDFFSSYATLRYRGHDSLNYDKKSYKLNLKKYDNKTLINNNHNLLGMRNDNSWILDAMYVDYSKIRNKLSSDLWKIISDMNVLNAQYVELFIDNQYHGLYCLKEPIDNKALNVSNDGAIYKSILYLNYAESNVSRIDDKYFVRKYPDYVNYSSTLLYNKISDYYYYLKDDSVLNDDLIVELFDLNNVIDYQVFISLIKGVDNAEYNNYYYSISDSSDSVKIIKTPWDMDLTFGLTFNRVFDYDKYSEMGINVYFNDAPMVNQLIKQRYWELRENVITMDVINEYLDSYKGLLVSSGASKRDSDRWYYYDIENEIEKIRTWANNRIQFLDEYFKI